MNYYQLINGKYKPIDETNEEKTHVMLTCEEYDGLREHLSEQTKKAISQTFLNAELLRISKERANAARDIRPKKTSDGYLILRAEQYTEHVKEEVPEEGFEAMDLEWLRKNKKIKTEKRTVPAWKTIIQTPYDAEIAYDAIAEEIYEDINNHRLRDCNCDGFVKPEFNGDTDTILHLMNESDENLIYRWRFIANYTSRQWELHVYTLHPFTVQDFRVPPRRTKKS